MLTQEQIDNRYACLGGSDAAAALGLSRYMSPLELWAVKVGRVKPEDISSKIAVILGNRLESTVADMFESETGKKLMRRNHTLYHPKYPFIAANIDRLVIGEDAGFEAKTLSAYRAKELEDGECPQEFLVQCYHYMAVTGRKTWYLAMLIGNQDFQWRKLEYDKSVCDSLIAKEVHFWNTYVIPKVIPAHITGNDGNVLYQLFPIADPNADVILGQDALLLIEQIEAMQADSAALDNQIEAKKNQIKAILGDAEQGRTAFHKVTWKLQNTNRLDVKKLQAEKEAIYKEYLKTTPSRVLRISKLKD